MTIFNQISKRIIKEQELIIGSLAWEEAKKVPGLKIDNSTEEILFEGNEKEIINKLVNQYSKLFGKASSEACKDAVQDLLAELPQEQIPETLA